MARPEQPIKSEGQRSSIEDVLNQAGKDGAIDIDEDGNQMPPENGSDQAADLLGDIVSGKLDKGGIEITEDGMVVGGEGGEKSSPLDQARKGQPIEIDGDGEAVPQVDDGSDGGSDLLKKVAQGKPVDVD